MLLLVGYFFVMIIAVDGHSSCGKSTLSKALAAELGYIYIDTGAMYRAVTLYFLNYDIDIADATAVDCALQDIDISFELVDGRNTTFLNGVNVEADIRGMRVSSFVSEVAAIPAVRSSCVAMQRLMGQGKNIVMDGRDIGTTVFPNADLKLYITADSEVRAMRRYEELQAKGVDVTLEQVRANLMHRDHIDSTRETSPLRQAEDAVVINNSNLTRAEQLTLAISLVDKITKK